MRFANQFTFFTLTLIAGFLFAAAPKATAQAPPPATSGGKIGLPQSSGDIGKLKRGRDGKIVWTGPSEKPPDISSDTVISPSVPNVVTAGTTNATEANIQHALA